MKGTIVHKTTQQSIKVTLYILSVAILLMFLSGGTLSVLFAVSAISKAVFLAGMIPTAVMGALVTTAIAQLTDLEDLED